MKRPEGSNLKTYCYRAYKDCDIVETGFNLLIIYYCKQCKIECSEALKNQKVNNEPDDFPIWGINLDPDDTF